MWNLKTKLQIVVVLALSLGPTLALAQDERSAPGQWSSARANAWYAQQEWPVGANYLPRDAINQLEMWQAATFNPQEIDQEFGWAQTIGMNTMRVFLHDLLWQEDSKGFTQRLNTFLQIAQKHHIRPVLVLFDSCWDPNPHLGPQHPPVPGIHNSGWVQSPGLAALRDPSQLPRLHAYVTGIVGAFAHDPRILAWDVWNEPEADNSGSYSREGQEKDKADLVLPLLRDTFQWAREAHPDQPLTSGMDDHDWDNWSKLDPLEKVQISNSDILSFHLYDWPENFERHILQLKVYGRPIVCTEYMARGAGSTFDTTLPIAYKYRIGAINWGFVRGKSQTWLPWDSWQHPYIGSEPTVWFHDVLNPDGTPYRPVETDQILRLTEEAKQMEKSGDPSGEQRAVPGERSR